MDIEVQALVLARAIQETGSITGAAQHLGYSQPAVSQQLRRIESRLGVALVTRVGRSVRLTEAGSMLAARARVIGAEISSTFDAVADLAGGVTGHVRLAAFPSASSSIIPTFLVRMRDRHPGIDATSIEEEPPEAAQMLTAGTVDIAMTFSYDDDFADPHAASVRGLSARAIFTEPVYAVLPADHPAAAAAAVSLSGLADADWIAGCPRCRGHLLTVCRRAGFDPRIRRETDNVIAVLGMVTAGLGIGLLPSTALSSIGVPDGVVILPTDPGSPRTVHVVTTHGARRVPAIAAALDVIDEVSHSVATRLN